jgi:ribonuclease-3
MTSKLPDAIKKKETGMENIIGLWEIGYEFKNLSILKEALTHRSFSCEHGLSYDNQRLEFFGDSVFQIVITEYLYKKYPDADEGELTKMRAFLAQKSTLAKFAKELSLYKFVRMGKGELRMDGTTRMSTLCDTFEALCAAIYLDGGLAASENFLIPLIENFYPSPKDLIAGFNFKGCLQELTQSKFAAIPVYKVEEAAGPDHKKNFTVSVSVNGKILAKANANTRKGAEAEAACAAAKIIESNEMGLGESEKTNK